MALEQIRKDMLAAAEKESHKRIQEIMMISLLMGDEDTFIYIAQYYSHCFDDAEGKQLCIDIVEEARARGLLYESPNDKPLH